MFFNGWENIYRTIIIGILSYVLLILILRMFGKRTLSKMNAFDLVVTVALGSILATILLNKNVALAEGFTAIAVLIVLQYAVAWTAVRSEIISNIIKSSPVLLFYNNEFLHAAMKKERIEEKEIWQAARNQGVSSMHQVEAVVLESDGTVSVITTSNDKDHSTMENVKDPKHS
ncbi:DUF421 domain-containing protein [Paenibacillus sp. JX-17]|uniref:DUF421 domain-containing protein n=1 Tax=Paenibacillus lacisoli TaxID=3064525 RepID=A0ABT9CGT3_9BACL|nr:YetF domain-containing protein [Paenibacillus sp. JX-17]MDO7908110.1 DUF421 domain-containing protein [Paenibacillus sp. JX-17]